MWGRTIFKNLSENPSAQNSSKNIVHLHTPKGKTLKNFLPIENNLSSNGRKMHGKLIGRKKTHRAKTACPTPHSSYCAKAP
jgi:hypothetical protein